MNLDKLYEHDGLFLVLTKEGSVIKTTLSWEQGRFNNYRFLTSDCGTIVWPEEILKVTIIPEEDQHKTMQELLCLLT